MSDTERVQALIKMIKKCCKKNLLKSERNDLSNIKKKLERSLKNNSIDTHTIDVLSMQIYNILG